MRGTNRELDTGKKGQLLREINREINRDSPVYWCPLRREWMGMGVAGIHSYCGSFPHSLRLAPVSLRHSLVLARPGAEPSAPVDRRRGTSLLWHSGRWSRSHSAKKSGDWVMEGMWNVFGMLIIGEFIGESSISQIFPISMTILWVYTMSRPIWGFP